MDYSPAVARMPESKAKRMKPKAPERAFLAAVGAIAHYGVPHFRKVRPDLIFSTGFQADL